MLSYDACYVKIAVGSSDSDDFHKIVDVNNSFIQYFGFLNKNNLIHLPISCIMNKFVADNHEDIVKKYQMTGINSEMVFGISY